MSDQPKLHVVLFQPEIPQNTGNIGRTCVAVGAKLWLVRPFAFRIDDTHVRRAGLDYWQHLDWQDVASWDELTAVLAPRRFWLFTKFASRFYTDVTYAAGDVLVFGNESQGLPPSIHERYAENLLRIPMREEARSLNLSNAAAIAMYEAVRQIK